LPRALCLSGLFLCICACSCVISPQPYHFFVRVPVWSTQIHTLVCICHARLGCNVILLRHFCSIRLSMLGYVLSVCLPEVARAHPRHQCIRVQHTWPWESKLTNAQPALRPALTLDNAAGISVPVIGMTMTFIRLCLPMQPPLDGYVHLQRDWDIR